MEAKVLGFLNIRGWPGVVEILIITAAGVSIGVTLIYLLLIRNKTVKPKKRRLLFLIIAAVFFSTLLTMVVSL